MNKIETEDIKELFAEWGLWSLVEDISDDGDGHGDNLQLTHEGLEAQRMIYQLLLERTEEAYKMGYIMCKKDFIKLVENLRSLTSISDPISENIKSKQEGELEAYNSILSKLLKKKE